MPRQHTGLHIVFVRQILAELIQTSRVGVVSVPCKIIAWPPSLVPAETRGPQAEGLNLLTYPSLRCLTDLDGRQITCLGAARSKTCGFHLPRQPNAD